MNAVQRWLLHFSTFLLALSGLAYAAMKYLLAGSDPYSPAGHPLQPWALSVHVLVVPVALFGVGWIFRDHIMNRIRQRNSKPGSGGGVVTTLLLLPVVASGTLLQVVTAEVPRGALALVHLAIGALYTATYTAHIIRGGAAPEQAATDGGGTARAGTDGGADERERRVLAGSLRAGRSPRQRRVGRLRRAGIVRPPEIRP